MWSEKAPNRFPKRSDLLGSERGPNKVRKDQIRTNWELFGPLSDPNSRTPLGPLWDPFGTPFGHLWVSFGSLNELKNKNNIGIFCDFVLELSWKKLN